MFPRREGRASLPLLLALSVIFAFTAGTNSFAELRGGCVKSIPGNCPENGGGRTPPPPPPPPPPPQKTKAQKISEWREKGDRAMRQRRWEDALKFYREALQLAPKDRALRMRYDRARSQWNFSRGEGLFAHGRADEAYPYLKEALRFSPDPGRRAQIKKYLEKKVYPQTKKGKEELAWKARQEKLRKERAAQKQADQKIDNQLGLLGGKLENKSLKNQGSALNEVAQGAPAGSALEQLRVAHAQGKSGAPGDLKKPYDTAGSASGKLALVKGAGKIPPVGKAGAVELAKLAREMTRGQLVAAVMSRKTWVSDIEGKLKKVKDPKKKARFMNDQIQAMGEHLILLDEEIKREKNPITQGILISEQTNLRSAKRVKEIQVKDLSVLGPSR